VPSEQERVAAVRQNLDRIGKALKRVDDEFKQQKASQVKSAEARKKRSA